MWVNTRKVLDEFNQILICKICNKRITNPQQFLNCGHFACAKCVGSETTCLQCNIPGRAIEVYSDKTMRDLLINLNTIAETIALTSIAKEDEFASESKCTKKESVISKSSRSSSRKTFSLKPSMKRKTIDETLICEHKMRKSSTIAIPKNLNKPNHHGETKLHENCKKNNIMGVEDLLEAGANPNTIDHTGWTPLQEAANLGYMEVCELLLKAGAKPDIHGLQNRTALHEAVMIGNEDLVFLLLEFNANKDVIDNEGKKPRDYCESKEIEELLDHSSLASEEHNKSLDLDDSEESKIVLYGSDLKLQNQKLLTKLGIDKKLKVVDCFSSIVTHVFVEAETFCNMQLSFDILLTILHGKWLLNSDGLTILLENSNITADDLSVLELNLPRCKYTLMHARENVEKQHPKLFNNCFFYFVVENNDTIYYDGLSLKKEYLTKLASAGDGIILTSEPKPEDILNSLSPFHVANNPKHSLHKCTHYIIYIPEERPENSKRFKRLLYNLPFLKSLPIMWFIESILNFRLIDPADLGITAA